MNVKIKIDHWAEQFDDILKRRNAWELYATVENGKSFLKFKNKSKDYKFWANNNKRY